MKKRLSLSKLQVQSFVTNVQEVKGGLKRVDDGGDDTYRLACTAEDCSVGSCPGAYCPDQPSPGVTDSPQICIPL